MSFSCRFSSYFATQDNIDRSGCCGFVYSGRDVKRRSNWFSNRMKFKATMATSSRLQWRHCRKWGLLVTQQRSRGNLVDNYSSNSVPEVKHQRSDAHHRYCKLTVRGVDVTITYSINDENVKNCSNRTWYFTQLQLVSESRFIRDVICHTLCCNGMVTKYCFSFLSYISFLTSVVWLLARRPVKADVRRVTW